MSNNHDLVRSYSYKGRHRRESLQMRKAAVAVATVGAAAAAPLIGGGVAHADTTSVWDRVAQCESTNNWSINTGNGFSGGLQFTDSTWAAYGGTQYAPEAYQASKQQQIAVAQRVLAGQGSGAWPVCSVQAGLTSSNGGSSSAPVSNDQTQSQPAQQAAPAAPKPQAVAQATTPEPTPTPVQSVQSLGGTITGSTYVVHLGDSLSKIAQRASVDWHNLYAHNKKVVGANPNVIYPGQRLSLTR